jgi:hypothetical protein
METECESISLAFLTDSWIARNFNRLDLQTAGQSNVNVIVNVREVGRFGKLDATAVCV